MKKIALGILSFSVASSLTFSFSLAIEDALKIWENGYKQGKLDCENQNLKVKLTNGYYVVITQPIPDWLAGLFKFVARRDYPANYIGYKKGKVLYLLKASSLTEARDLKGKFDKELEKVLDKFNIDTYIVKITD
jgi:hypothetical protein